MATATMRSSIFPECEDLRARIARNPRRCSPQIGVQFLKIVQAGEPDDGGVE